ncbi:MAG: transposase [Thioploca sp.]|nr:transposase [Thioploca sp.]
MSDINTVLLCLSTVLSSTNLDRLQLISYALLAMDGRVTMLGISRWTEKGGSYRTIQRFFKQTFSWCRLNWYLITGYLSDDDVILIAKDETTVTKSGQHTYGLGRYFSSIFNRAIPGLSFFTLSLISVKRRQSFPLVIEPVAKEEEEQPAKTASPKGKKKPGRPKGSRHKTQSTPELSARLLWTPALLRNLLKLIGTRLKPVYFVYDSAWGNNDCIAMLKPLELKLISKRRHDAALGFPDEGKYSGRGAPRKYGDKVNYADMPDRYRKYSEVTLGILTPIYQIKARHKRFAQSLNVVIIRKTNLKTGKTTQVIWFSSDLELAWDKLIDYYRLRFQIEFNFRDAKQFWGLEDFMNVGQTQIHHATNLSMFMVNLSYVLRQQTPFFSRSILDLKAWFKADKYVREILKLLPQSADLNFNDRILPDIAQLGRINTPVEVG